MVRNILPLASFALMLGMSSAFAADAALTARVTAAAEKACPTQVYEGPSHLFYPETYKAEHYTCVRLVTRSALKQIASAGTSYELLAQK
jgi:hypothetical protein